MMEPRQTPTFEANIPDDLSGDGRMACELASAYFGDPLPWQPHLLDAMLARDERDRYVLRSIGISVPRQNGKSWVVRARCFYGALNGEKILYTCQHGDTSDQMFQELAQAFEDESNPELHDLLLAVRRTNGQQAIKLRNGGLIRFTTRTDSLARGKTYDVLIYDEAQELTEKQQAASLPAISAGAKHNPQTIYLGTPPNPDNIGTVFLSLHEAVHSGKSKMGWIEWGATEIGDVNDEARWYEFNPSMGILLDHAAVKGEAEQMQPDVFARERLGWWSPVGGKGIYALISKKWRDCEVASAPREGKLAFGVKFSHDSLHAAVSWALADRDGPSYVELYDVMGSSGGTVAISDMLLRNRDEIACVCIDGKSGADALRRRMLDGGFPKTALVMGTPAIVQAASSMLSDEVNAGTLSHIASPALDDSATGSLKRDVGRDGWGFADGPNSMAAPIESASLALWAARTTKRDPRREQEASF
ncbi:ATP-binding protein [Parolsenella catena]|jgi:hypothetical protein|uniref:ATP-binding protein n=1 Tax=Parolsenella catena TaxID=2003188 RepID=UPI00204ADEA4|nr:MAG TPA: Large Terminase [Caudoviricetes sp.]